MHSLIKYFFQSAVVILFLGLLYYLTWKMASDRPNRVTYINEMIPHIQQFTKNDCGIACFKMALKWVSLLIRTLDKIKF